MREKISSFLPAIEAVVEKALAKDPQERFPSLHQMSQAFEEACLDDELTLSAIPPTIRRSLLTAPTIYGKDVLPSPLPATQRATPRLEGSEVPELPDPSMSRREVLPALSRRTVVIGLSTVGLVAAGGGLTAFLIARHNAAVSRSSVIFTAPPSPTVPISPPDPIGTTLIDYKKHTGNVYAVSWSPNGQYLASGSADTTWRSSLAGRRELSFFLCPIGTSIGTKPGPRLMTTGHSICYTGSR